MRLRCFLLVLCSVFSLASHSQKIIFENIGVRNGLPASEVYNLHQDERGYLWIFTEYGIVKYNGTSYVPVCKNLPLKKSAIYSIAESGNGNMYIVNSKAEVYRIQNDRAFKVAGVENITSEVTKKGMNICEAFFTDNGDLWVTTFKQSYRISNKKLQLKGLPADPPKKNKHKRAAIIKNTVNEDASDIRGVVLLNSGKVLPLKHERILGSSRNMYFEMQGNIYFVENEGVRCDYRNGSSKFFDTQVSINKVKTSSNGHIWICLNTKGLLELDKNLNVVNRYFENQIVSDVLFDNQAGMWVSTIGKGIYHCDNLSKKSFTTSSDLSEEICLIQETNGKLFIGTSQGKLFFQDKTGLKKIETPSNMLAPIQVYFYQGKYFVATKSFIGELNGNRFVYQDPRIKYGATVFGMTRYDQNRLLVISPTTIDLYNPNTLSLKRVRNNGKNRHLTERRPGEYFMTTNEGILLMKDGKFSYPSCLAELKDKNVSSIVVDQHKNLWFSTKGDGVYCLNKRNILVHYVNLPVNIVYNINFTKSGLVLLSTNQGAFATKRENINNKRFWKLVLNEETLLMKEYKNKLYIGTKKGLTVIDKQQIFAFRKYRFYLSSVKSKNGYQLLLKNKALKHYQNNIYFSYDLLDFQKHNSTLEYSVTGPTKLSGTVIGNALYLQNLAPGEYKLEVYPKMLFGDSKRLKHTIVFSIQPAFWQTTVFWVLMVLLFMGLMFFIFWMFSRRRNRVRLAREEMERQLVEYRLTALKSQINPHFMSNSLVAIQNLILLNETDSANLYIAKFSLLLRSLLDYSIRSTASLKSELDMIVLYVELEQLRFSNKFEFEIVVAPEINSYDTYIPTLITQPFIENAIWHGLLPLKDHRRAKLLLNVYLEKETLIISIIDNGVGREYHRERKNDRDSKGTELIANRIETLNQLYKTTGGKIEITDLKSTEGRAIGTVVNIELPETILNELYENKEV